MLMMALQFLVFKLLKNRVAAESCHFYFYQNVNSSFWNFAINIQNIPQRYKTDIYPSQEPNLPI